MVETLGEYRYRMEISNVWVRFSDGVRTTTLCLDHVQAVIVGEVSKVYLPGQVLHVSREDAEGILAIFEGRDPEPTLARPKRAARVRVTSRKKTTAKH